MSVLRSVACALKHRLSHLIGPQINPALFNHLLYKHPCFYTVKPYLNLGIISIIILLTTLEKHTQKKIYIVTIFSLRNNW